MKRTGSWIPSQCNTCKHFKLPVVGLTTKGIKKVGFCSIHSNRWHEGTNWFFICDWYRRRGHTREKR